MTENVEKGYKLYKRRWIIMALFMMYTINAGAQWLQFTIIGKLVEKYYGITPKEVEFTATTSMLAYIIFIFPSLYLMDKLGVRNTMIIGAAGITIGTWIKVFSVRRDLFYLALTGQSLQGVFQVLTFSLSARFTAIWFGAHEISIAGALGLFGDQLGTALSNIIPPILVEDGSTEEAIEDGLRKMHWYHAVISTAILVLIVLFFKSEPKYPPSAAQITQKQSERENVYQAVKSIVKKRSFILISLSYGLNLGLLNAILSHLQKIEHISNAAKVSSLMMFSGMFSSLFFGKIIDKTRKFKESAILLTTGSAIAFTAFTWALKSNDMISIYVTSLFFGSFVLSYYGTGFQMGIEVTFPISEEISSATLLLIAQLLNFIITTLYGYSTEKYGSFPSNVAVTVSFSISALCTFLVPSNLKRQRVERSAREKNREEELVDLKPNKTSN